MDKDKNYCYNKGIENLALTVLYRQKKKKGTERHIEISAVFLKKNEKESSPVIWPKIIM